MTGNWKWLPAFLIFAVIPLSSVPLFIDPYVQSKNTVLSILYLLGFLLVAGGRFHINDVYRPALFVSALVISSLANLDRGFHWPFWLEVVGYFGGLLYFGALISDHRFWPRFQSAVLWSSTGVLAIHFYQLASTLWNETLVSRRQYASTFGENNLMSQYLVLAFASILTKSGKPAICVRVLIVSVVLFNQSRSAILAILLLVAWQFWLDRKSSHLFGFGLSLVLAIGTTFVSQARLSGVTTLPVRDFGSWQQRLEVAKESLFLIQSSPFGVGPDQFQFESISHFQEGEHRQSERDLYTNPHSEILRLATSGGWLLLIAGLALLVEFVRRLRKMPSAQKKIPTLLFIAFLPELLFQFPFDIGTTVSFVLVSFAAASVTYEDRNGLNWLLARRSVAVVFVCVLVSLGANIALLYSGYLARHAKSADQAVQACHLNFRQWQICEIAISRLEAENRFLEAKDLIDGQLKHYPNNFLALRHLSRFHFAKGNNEAGCGALKAEARLMKSAFTAGDFLERHCNQ
ncbi:MAG: O-antigen ligase family protein [Bdellovibrionales bacterium]|nr:O-antigen ligase family protein [Bdellovibrionales bacterium]